MVLALVCIKFACYLIDRILCREGNGRGKGKGNLVVTHTWFYPLVVICRIFSAWGKTYITGLKNPKTTELNNI